MLVELFIHHLEVHVPRVMLTGTRYSKYKDCSTSDCQNADLRSLLLTFITDYYSFQIRKR